jgi:hypothetical protein
MKRRKKKIGFANSAPLPLSLEGETCKRVK